MSRSILQGTGAPHGNMKDEDLTWQRGHLVRTAWTLQEGLTARKKPTARKTIPQCLEALLFSAQTHCQGCKAEAERMEKRDGWDEGAELPSAA